MFLLTLPSLRNGDALANVNLAAIGNLGELVVAGLERNRPVDEVELDKSV